MTILIVVFVGMICAYSILNYIKTSDRKIRYYKTIINNAYGIVSNKREEFVGGITKETLDIIKQNNVIYGDPDSVFDKTSWTKDSIWTNVHGVSKPLKDLDDSHLANLLDFLDDNVRNGELREVIKSIAKDRGLKDEYLERSQIPYKNPNGKYEICDKEKGFIEVSE